MSQQLACMQMSSTLIKSVSGMAANKAMSSTLPGQSDIRLHRRVSCALLPDRGRVGDQLAQVIQCGRALPGRQQLASLKEAKPGGNEFQRRGGLVALRADDVEQPRQEAVECLPVGAERV